VLGEEAKDGWRWQRRLGRDARPVDRAQQLCHSERETMNERGSEGREQARESEVEWLRFSTYA